MALPPSQGKVVAPGAPTFALHTLGWRAFQDLCGTVLSEVWGQSVQVFADSNDAGRDGAFYGVWALPPSSTGFQDIPDGPFVLQCKHTKSADSTLTPSELEGEFKKVPSLVRRGLCRTYVLLTNARVTGESEAVIRGRLMAAGVVHPLVFAGNWLCNTIAANRNLRTFVPRVYGLGDLSQILDERAYAQASILMAAAKDQLATFVITEPYRKAVRSLEKNGFVLLLGEPAVGKSVIAMMLALGSADKWKCMALKPRSASELVDRWNPHESGQFFWVDDAFGAVRHDAELTRDWLQSLPHVMAAIDQGARVVLTSRGYIYREARPLLKEYAYPRLREQQVAIDVEALTVDERKQILYNHLNYGDQPVDVRRKMKPHLDSAAIVAPFRPEVARRLGLRAFTARLTIDRAGIEDFMQKPTEFLHDVYGQLDSDSQAALGLVYVATRDGNLSRAAGLDAQQLEIIASIGGTPAGVMKAVSNLVGTFLREDGDPFSSEGVSFRHPTLREGFASWISRQPHLLGILIAGFPDQRLADQIDCTNDVRQGTLLKVPSVLYRDIAERFASTNRRVEADRDKAGIAGYNTDYWNWKSSLHRLLAERSSDEFLKAYTERDPSILEDLSQFKSYGDFALEPPVLARIYRAGLLPESVRASAIDTLCELVAESPDAGWIEKPEWNILLAPLDRARLIQVVRDLVPHLEDLVGEWTSEDADDDDGSVVEAVLARYAEMFVSMDEFDIASEFEGEREAYANWVRERLEDAADNNSEDFYWDDDLPYRGEAMPFAVRPVMMRGEIKTRSIFDDIDQ